MFASVVLFTLFAGEAIRNSIGWWGFAGWAVFVAAVSVVVLIRSRGSALPRPAALRTVFRSPITWLTVFLVWCMASIAWSYYPLGTALGLLILTVTTIAALAVARLARNDRALPLRALTFALGAILAASIVFELVVAVVVRAPILPVFPIDVVPGREIPDAFYWSRALLLEGGRIQGIVGNANLLGFIALLGAVVGVATVRTHVVPRWVAVATAVLGALVLVLTRSSTVLVAAAAVAVVAALVVCFRAGRSASLRRRVGWALVAVLVVGAAVGALFARPLLAAIGKSPDLTGRLDIWAAVLGLFGDRPVAGWGWIGYWQPWIPLFDDLAERRGVVYLQAHDAYLDVAFQVGTIGLLFFLALLVTTAARALRATRQTLVPVLLLTALVVQALAESRLLYEGNWALLVLLAVGAFATLPREDGADTTAPRPVSPKERGTRR